MDNPSEYDIKSALHDAATLLSSEFGEADQKAAVDLATFLWRSRVHEQFQKAHPQPDSLPYGGGPEG